MTRMAVYATIWLSPLFLLGLLMSFTVADTVFSKRLDGFTFTSFLGVSLKECRSLCKDRPRCLSVNYSRMKQECQLNSKKQTNNILGLSTVPEFVYEDVNEAVQTCGTNICNKNKACNKLKNTCEITECLTDVAMPTHGKIIGNQNSVGSGIRLECDEGYWVKDGILTQSRWIISTCQISGVWSVQSYSCEPCYLALVTGPHGIEDSAISVSSFYDLDIHRHINASRLHFQGTAEVAGAWTPRTNDVYQYIQARFTSVMSVNSVQTQGRNSPNLHQWMTAYKLGYSKDCLLFTMVTNNDGTDKIFSGNYDTDTIVTNDLQYPVRALCIRLYPMAWHKYISLRFEILGCLQA